MLKKAATQGAMKEQYEKLLQRVNKNVEDVEKLVAATNLPGFAAVPDHNVLQNLLGECEDSDFWLNFKKAAPIIFCTALEGHQSLKQISEMSFAEELLKTKAIMRLLQIKLEKGDADVDIVEYSLATKMLESKMQVLYALNVQVDANTPEFLYLNVKGSNKSIKVDINKLKEAITVCDDVVEEKEGSLEPKRSSAQTIDTTNITEDEFLTQALEIIGPV